jgi:2-hydroxy-6-oxonona-2,4-dienedioate hydrolase
MRVEFAEIGGAATRFYSGGDGPPLLLIHGVGASADIWMRNLEALSRDFTVYAPDVLDNGFTGQGAYRGGPPQGPMLDHIEAFLDHHKIGAFAAIGSSFGGLLSALLHLRRPEALKQLVLVSSGTCFNTEDEVARTLSESYQNGLSAIANPSLETCRKRMANVVFDPACVPDALYLMQLTIYGLANTLPAYERRMKGLMDVAGWRAHRIAERVQDIKARTLLVWGRDDPRVIPGRAEAAVKRMADATLVSFERCRHFPQLEHPDRFNALVRAFLRGERIASAA